MLIIVLLTYHILSHLILNIIAADKVDTPRIISDRTGGTVERGHVVKLEVAHGDAAIYYTLDGTAPELHKLSPKVTILALPQNYFSVSVECILISILCHEVSIVFSVFQKNIGHYPKFNYWITENIMSHMFFILPSIYWRLKYRYRN